MNYRKKKVLLGNFYVPLIIEYVFDVTQLFNNLTTICSRINS